MAVIVVVVFHLGRLQGGYLGVDLFFVLSGYLITSLLLAEGGAGRGIGLVRFWERRARRLLPALGVLLVGVAAYARFAAQPEELHRIRWDGIATLLYVANWRQIFGRADYWAMFTSPSPLDHTWSLAIEEQFYLVWPLVFVAMTLLVARRTRDRAASEGDAARTLAGFTLILALVLSALSLAWAGYLEHVDGWNRVYFGTDTRAFAILVGAAVASSTMRFGPVRSGRPRHVLELGGMLSGVLLVVAWATLSGASSIVRHGGLAACSVAGALLIASVAHPEPGWVARCLSWRPLRWMGLISYGVYLYHWPIIVWLDPVRAHLTGLPLAALQVALTLFVSYASYRWIEQPIRRGARWRPRTNLLVPVTSFGVATVLILGATVTDVPGGRVDVEATTRHAIQQSNGTKGPRIVIGGNSVGFYLNLEGFTTLQTDPKVAYLSLAQVGCTYPGAGRRIGFDGKVYKRFANSCNNGWERAVARFRPDYFVFVRDGFQADRYEHDGRFISVCTPEFHEWAVATFDRDVEQFAKYGTKLVLVTGAPSLYFLLQTKDRIADNLLATACGNRILRDVAADHPDSVVIVDLAAHVCPDNGRCRKKIDGVEIRPDGTHYRGRGAQMIAKWILAQIGIEATIPP